MSPINPTNPPAFPNIEIDFNFFLNKTRIALNA